MSGVVSFRQLRLLVATLVAEGRDVVSLLTAFDRTPLDVMDPQGHLPAESWGAFWQAAAGLAGDDAVAVRAALRLDVMLYAMVAHDSDYTLAQLLWVSGSVGEAYGRLARYHDIFNEALDYEVEWRAGNLWVGLRSRVGPLPAAARVFALAWPLQVVRAATKQPLVPLSWSLRGEVRGLSEIEGFFGVSRGGDDDDGLLFSAEQQAAPSTMAEPGLAEVVEARARAMQAARDGGFLTRVRELLDRGLAAPRTQAEIARALGLSDRTLARRLAAHGTSYRALVDGYRADRSRVLLAEGRSARDVALLLGFSDERAWRRAYVRWFGETPKRP